MLDIREEISSLTKLVSSIRTELYLSGKYDRNNAIISIHAGQGGTESCDFSQMLFRMYQRWSERNGYKFQILDILQGAEAGYKTATFSVSGEFAFGYLKSEAGVHRIKRISPYGGGERHTSFAGVDITPEVDEVTSVEIDPNDLEIQTFRASSKGGQNANKVSSACRIIHLPTKITTQCQIERDQWRNKQIAMKMLVSKLLAIKIKEHEQEQQSIKPDKKQNAWGSQIRTYSLDPESYVKDHRTGYRSHDPINILDGNIQEIIDGLLIWKNHE